MNTEIHQFFEAYRDAFDRLDGEAVAQLYTVPSGLVTDQGYMHWSSLESIRNNMIGLCKLYQDNGYLSARYELAVFFPQGDVFAVADIAWYIERQLGLEPWCFHTTYNLIRTSQGWRILLATVYEEKPPADHMQLRP